MIKTIREILIWSALSYLLVDAYLKNNQINSVYDWVEWAESEIDAANLTIEDHGERIKDLEDCLE